MCFYTLKSVGHCDMIEYCVYFDTNTCDTQRFNSFFYAHHGLLNIINGHQPENVYVSLFLVGRREARLLHISIGILYVHIHIFCKLHIVCEIA